MTDLPAEKATQMDQDPEEVHMLKETMVLAEDTVETEEIQMKVNPEDLHMETLMNLYSLVQEEQVQATEKEKTAEDQYL